MVREDLIKVEIKIVNMEWQWMGLLSEANLKLLCAIADTMNDSDIDIANKDI